MMIAVLCVLFVAILLIFWSALAVAARADEAMREYQEDCYREDKE